MNGSEGSHFIKLGPIKYTETFKGVISPEKIKEYESLVMDLSFYDTKEKAIAGKMEDVRSLGLYERY